jgi:NADPH-dependent 2,4-dienoyl-CoA reductase/sulfur reductase-like enzyme/nitrite reductase/ring-hydroxylating ferredoxin subunit
MPFQKALPLAELPSGSKKAVKLGETEILLLHTESGRLHAVEAKCPHAGAPLEESALCDGHLVCPWHTGTFAIGSSSVADGTLLEPPPLRSLKHYPVKQENGSILVDPEPVNQPSLAHDDDLAPATAVAPHAHIVTIGAGAAATAAVCTLRQHGFAGRITMVDPVDSEPTDRTNLSKMTLAGKKPIAKLPLWTPEERDKLAVERVLAKVTALDANAGTLNAEKPGAGKQEGDPISLHFDAALLATGAIPNRLDIPGENLSHVHTLRHVHDVIAIEALLGDDAKSKEAVLIGDSFIAFEAASALTTRGVRVTLVCRSPQPFSRKFGESPAQSIVGLHRSHGVTLKLGAEARSIADTGVTLKSGETLPADLVLVAVGVHPATGFEHHLPLEKDGGIPTDDTLRAAPKLWVAGDLASVGGTRIEHWRLAEQHGRNAALGMLASMAPSADQGPSAPETIVPFFWTTHFGKRFGYVGHADGWDEIQVDGSLGDLNFLAYYLKNDTVQAILGCGKDAAIAAFSVAMRKELSLHEARAAISGM